MRARFFLVLYIVVTVFITAACTTRESGSTRRSHPSRSPYTEARALELYDYQPARALRIIDSAVIVGTLSPQRAELNRMRVYAWTVMGAQVDSLLHGPHDVRFDSATAIGERLLADDSIRENLRTQQIILEVLVYAARQRQDTTLFFRRSCQLVEVCHAQGAETEALRTEAEVGAALCKMGRRDEGMAHLDSVIAVLDGMPAGFNELDAAVIALKRKMAVLCEEGAFVEAIPLARRIIERLEDYEKHPDQYHDGSYREPSTSVGRADYIEFYRTQAQSAITAAYAFLGKQTNMNEAYTEIEHSVREATAREHIARYRALEHQMRRAEAENRSRLMTLIAVISVVTLTIILLFAAYIYFANRRIRQKNRALVKLIERSAASSLPGSIEGGAALFSQIDTAIRSERLYANPDLQRQDVCDRFGIRRDVLSQLLADYASAQSFPAYINAIRLSEACRLLREHPSMTVNAIADDIGLSPRNLRRLFVEQYSMTPTEYRQGLQV